MYSLENPWKAFGVGWMDGWIDEIEGWMLPMIG